MTRALLALLDHVSQSIHIDPDRISLSGIDNGSNGAWKLAKESPRRFAAIAAVVTDGELNPGENLSIIMNEMPGRVFVKNSDVATINTINGFIRNSKFDWQLLKIGNQTSALSDHSIYSDYTFLHWLVQQHRTTL